MSTFYEIIELINGDVALQRPDGEKNEPMVTIRFSAESLAFLGEAKFTVAKAMIEAGMDAVGDLTELQADAVLDDMPDEIGGYEKLILH